MPFIVYRDVTDMPTTSNRALGIDTSQPVDDDTSYAVNQDNPEYTLEGQARPSDELEESRPRLEVSPDMRGADLTPLTGMSSELHRMSLGSLIADPERDIVSGDEADDSDTEGLSTIWAVNGVTKHAIIEVLTERVRRHIKEKVQRNDSLDPTPKEYARMVRNLAIIEAERYTRKKEARGTSVVSITSSLSHGS